MNSDEQAIRKLMQDWHRLTREGNLEALITLMTDDAMFLTCGNPPMTRRDFAAAFRDFAGKVRIESSQDVKELHVSGDLAYAWSKVSVAMTATEGGARMERAGHVLSIFRKDAAGRWQLARDANLMLRPG
jgi:uncharacterized protein (TIGR02246 family)